MRKKRRERKKLRTVITAAINKLIEKEINEFTVYLLEILHLFQIIAGIN